MQMQLAVRKSTYRLTLMCQHASDAGDAARQQALLVAGLQQQQQLEGLVLLQIMSLMMIWQTWWLNLKGFLVIAAAAAEASVADAAAGAQQQLPGRSAAARAARSRSQLAQALPLLLLLLAPVMHGCHPQMRRVCCSRMRLLMYVTSLLTMMT